MATIRNGGNEAFSGKAGSFIGSNWRDQGDPKDLQQALICLRL